MNKKKHKPDSTGDLERAHRASGKSPESANQIPEPEVKLSTQLTSVYDDNKLSILEQADKCNHPGEVGALLRREGLYSSHLSTWRRSRQRGTLDGLRAKKRGPKQAPNTAQTKQLLQLQKRIQRLEDELTKAHTIIDVQKNSRQC